MAAVDEIAIKLGIKTGDLKAALADANASIKTFKKEGETGGDGFEKSIGKAKKGIETFKSVLGGAGVVALLKGLGEAATKFAEEYKGGFDADVASTLRLKEAHADLGSVVSNVTGRIGVSLVGALEKFGIAVGSIVYGTDAAADALNKLDAESKKAFDDSQLKKLREEEEKLAKVRRDSALENATAEEKVGLLAKEYIKLLQEQAKLKEGTIEWTKKTAEVETVAAQLRKQDNEVQKKAWEDRQKAADDAFDAEKKAAEERDKNLEKLEELNDKQADMQREELTLQERQKALLAERVTLEAELARWDVGSLEYNQAYEKLLKNRADLKKSENDAGKVNVEIAKILLVPEGQRTDLQKERLKLLTGETTEHKQQVELQTLLNQGVENLTEAELRRLRVLMGETVEITKQADEEERKAKALQAFYATSIKQSGNVENLSDVQLDQLMANLRKQLGPIKTADASYFGIGIQSGTYKSIEQLLLQQNLDAAIKEANLRSSFRGTVASFGSVAAERSYAPDEYARLSQLLNPDLQKQQARDISAISATIKNVFPDQYAGPR